MTLLDAPLWLQAILVAEAVALAWLTARFSWRGAVVGLAAGALSWLALGASGSFLVSRLDGGGPGGIAEVVMGAMTGTLRVALLAAPLLVLALLAGGLLFWRLRRKTW